LVQVGEQALADRYSYIPLIGLFFIVAWGLGDVICRWQSVRNLVIGGTAAVIVAFAVCSWLQAQHWKNSIALWEHALSVAADNATARNNLGLALLEEKDSVEEAAEAERHLRIAAEFRPNYLPAYRNLGMALARQEKNEDAIVWYQRAISIEPDLPETRNNLGIVLAKCHRLHQPIEQLEE